MDFFTAQDLPKIFDPVLNYLSDNLPRPIYLLLVKVLSHTLAILYGLFNLAISLKTWKPWEWDALTILPPLISILAAYYALVSIYRTTGWMIRAGITMIKWGTILAAIFAGIGWLLNNNVNGVGAMQDVTWWKQRAGFSSRYGTRPHPFYRKRRRPWDTFDEQGQWQYDDKRDGQYNDNQGSQQAQRVMDEILEVVGRGVGDGAANFIGSAWNILKNMGDLNDWMDSGLNENTESGEAGTSSTRKQPPRKAKATAKAKRTTKTR